MEPTEGAVPEEEAASIQAVFSALVEDQRRTDQICADVHDRVTAGRACLVLTQRPDRLRQLVWEMDIHPSMRIGYTPFPLRRGEGQPSLSGVRASSS